MGVERLYSIHPECTWYWASAAKSFLAGVPGALLPDGAGRESTCGRMVAVSAIREAQSGYPTHGGGSA